MENCIEIKELVKQYKGSEQNAVNAVSFNILRGEKFGIFGPNGAGKTSLISMICGIFEPTKGSVHFQLNNQYKTPRKAISQIGYVPQDFAFYPELTPNQNLTYFGKMYGIDSVILKTKIDLLLVKLGLDHVKNKKVQTFSGGMKRRINLAIGLINDPQILFLDEPTVGVDIQSKTAIFTILDELNKQGTTIIYTSHHLKEAENFCDRIALMDHGKIIGIGTLESLVNEHQVSDLEALLILLTGNKLRD